MAFLQRLRKLDHDRLKAEAPRDDGQLALADGIEILGRDGEGDAGRAREETEGGDRGATKDLDRDGLIESRVNRHRHRLPLNAGAEVLGVGGEGSDGGRHEDEQQ